MIEIILVSPICWKYRTRFPYSAPLKARHYVPLIFLILEMVSACIMFTNIVSQIVKIMSRARSASDLG